MIIVCHHWYQHILFDVDVFTSEEDIASALSLHIDISMAPLDERLVTFLPLGYVRMSCN